MYNYLTFGSFFYDFLRERTALSRLELRRKVKYILYRRAIHYCERKIKNTKITICTKAYLFGKMYNYLT